MLQVNGRYFLEMSMKDLLLLFSQLFGRLTRKPLHQAADLIYSVGGQRFLD